MDLLHALIRTQCICGSFFIEKFFIIVDKYMRVLYSHVYKLYNKLYNNTSVGKKRRSYEKL